jgi:hypothetical protein
LEIKPLNWKKIDGKGIFLKKINKFLNEKNREITAKIRVLRQNCPKSRRFLQFYVKL